MTSLLVRLAMKVQPSGQILQESGTGQQGTTS
jgi:hypothetical protein